MTQGSDRVIPGLYVGDIYSPRLFQGAIICVTDKRPEDEPERALHIPILVYEESGIIAPQERLDRAADAIWKVWQTGVDVLVHCHAGIERSPLVVTWFLHRHLQIPWNEAYKLVIRVRPEVQRRDHWVKRREG